MAGCDFIVNVTLDSQRRVTSVVAGDMERRSSKASGSWRTSAVPVVPKPVDIVVTSSAGYPLDTTFYQAVKGLTGCLPIVKEGGTIILAASLSEGLGSPEFQSLFRENPSLEVFMERILGTRLFRDGPVAARRAGQGARKARVKIVSDGFRRRSVGRALSSRLRASKRRWPDSLAEYGPDAQIAVIPKGPYVLPVLAE